MCTDSLSGSKIILQTCTHVYVYFFMHIFLTCFLRVFTHDPFIKLKSKSKLHIFIFFVPRVRIHVSQPRHDVSKTVNVAVNN